ncbi:MSS51-like protein, mitochondrial isoform X2 [Mycena sanguinolenta]|uniref:MSS51-like protein, mitochondrial isoform X2 n=1 Tax=Mycena sanguinolenta TaxID=230812 RepID=A0A8H6X8D4_9AGAR|nr:MSS51-like protein, mitochondrial isoform X2 [Mycena sanguinolenta]
MAAFVDVATLMNNQAPPNSLAGSSKKIRKQRKEFAMSCSACHKNEKDLGRLLRRCAKVCHTAFYCSKECQTQNWSVHKQVCGERSVSKLVPKLVKTMLSDPNMLVQLQSCFMLAFDLLQRARCDEMLLARVDIAVEPANLDDFSDILLRGESPNTAVQGMLQINAFTPVSDVEKSKVAAERRLVWCQERARADAAGFRHHPVVIMDVVHTDSQIDMTIPWRIASGMRAVVPAWISGGFPIPSAIPGQTTTVPCTVENCMQCINMHIRADTKNKLLLRTEMRPSDIQVIRDAGKNAKTVPAMILHAKIAREHIYESIYQKFLKRRKAATGVTPSIPVVDLSPC